MLPPIHANVIQHDIFTDYVRHRTDYFKRQDHSSLVSFNVATMVARRVAQCPVDMAFQWTSREAAKT